MSDLEALLRQRAPGPPQPPDSAPWEFLLGEPDLESRVWPLVSRLLVDDDPVVRARALEFVMTWRSDQTLPRLLEVAQSHADRFADQIVDGTRLRERLQHAVANRCTGRDAPEIVPVLMALFDGKPASPATAAVVGAHHPEKVALLDGGSKWVHDAVAASALYSRDKLPHLLSQLAARPADEREDLAAASERALEPDDQRAAKIAAKLGLPAPQQPAPTRDQIRRALSL